jgi:hypothetical protein
MRKCNREVCMKGSQPVEKLEEVIEEIREMMLKSVEEVVSRRRLNRGEPAAVAGKQQQQHKVEEQVDNSREKFGIQEDFNSGAEELMRSS